jgi:membrane associated rhomboid family serine protease
MAGFLLALLVAWVIGKAVTIKTTPPMPVPMDQGVFKELAWKLAGAVLLAILAGLCGVLTVGPVSSGPLFQVVLVAAAAAVGGGFYGAVVGWLEQRRVRRWAG